MAEGAFELLQEPIRQQISRQGIVESSTIQELAIPAILEGQNVLLIAPTGTGKTLAAILPVFDLFTSLKAREKTEGIGILYVTPLRALNRDLLRRLYEIGVGLDIEIQVRHGDTPAGVRAKQARSPPDMLITTPETLQAILPGRKMREHLKHIKWLIIDEIHELASVKRGTQLSLALERLRRLVGRDFQRIGLSATVGEAEKIAKFLTGSASKEAKVLKSAELRSLDVRIESLSPDQNDREEAKRLGIPPAAVSRARRTCELASKQRSTLIFTNTREHAEALGSQINAIGCRSKLRVHHGSLSREVREEVEADFQAGRIDGVICTSSLELGIDVGTVDLVIQYMSPREATRLVHRIGRSGHKIGAQPRGHIITTWADDILESAVLLNHAKREQFPEVKMHEEALDVLAHQTVGLALDTREISIDEAYKIVKGAYPYRNLELTTFSSVLDRLRQEGIIRLRDVTISPRFPRARQYYYENLSVIPDVKKYTVFDFNLKKRLGTLDQEFVAKRCRPGTEFIMHGHTWRVISVDDEGLSIEVEAVTPTLNAIPSWEGEIIPISLEVALEVGRLRAFYSEAADNASPDLARDLDPISVKRVVETVKEHSRNYPLPTDSQIVVERFENCLIVHSCFGNLVNETLGLVLSTLLQARLGVKILSQVDTYRIAFVAPIRLEPNLVADELLKLKPREVRGVVEASVEGTELFAWRHWHVAKRFGAVEAKADYSLRKAKLLVEVFQNTPINSETHREIYLEKLDIEGAVWVIQKIAADEIKVAVVDQKGAGCSPFALPMIDKIVPHDLIRPALPTITLAEIVKERLMSTNVRLICIFNGDWESVRAVGTLTETIRCPKCRSTLVAVAYHGDNRLLPIVLKKKNHRMLTDEEQEIWNTAWRSASLVQTAGRKAVLAMAARGVGPRTAARILRRRVRSEMEFYAEILKAEREYQRTRLFWD
ncbi:DEAD/DEAH box helicase [Candidatus Bathyarchaeota archaeon]|nr:DEAD/DEAH box helicase [Candidatus Bathyarchaeota archaeon]